MKNEKKVILIGGPTAVGKTEVAIHLARHFGAEIISADSRQCYKELAIGVARPTAAQLEAVPHHFIASHSIHQKVTAATFETFALEKTTALFKKANVVVMVGGTGLYMKAFCEGLHEVPQIPVAVQENIQKAYRQYGLNWLQQQVKKRDPLFFERGENQNPQRLMRALEVVQTTGSSILAYRKEPKKERDFSLIKIGIEIPREKLHQNIKGRVDKMMQEGLLEEVKTLLPYQSLNALQTVGYKELFAYLNGETNLPAAVEQIKTHTRQYAKRQLTWFKKGGDFQWFTSQQPGEIINLLLKALP